MWLEPYDVIFCTLLYSEYTETYLCWSIQWYFIPHKCVCVCLWCCACVYVCSHSHMNIGCLPWGFFSFSLLRQGLLWEQSLTRLTGQWALENCLSLTLQARGYRYALPYLAFLFRFWGSKLGSLHSCTVVLYQLSQLPSLISILLFWIFWDTSCLPSKWLIDTCTVSYFWAV